MKNKLKDRLLLILIAVMTLGSFLLLEVFLRAKITREWSKFIHASLGYFVILVNIAFTFEPFKKLPKRKILFFQAIYFILTTGIAFLVFKVGLLPLPKGQLSYIVPGTILTVGALVILGQLAKRGLFIRKKVR